MIHFETSVSSYVLNFSKPAGTSRGIYTTHKVWFVEIFSKEFPNRKGIGECAPLPDLSCDYVSDYEEILLGFCKDLELNGRLDYEGLLSYPSMLFGLETALRHYEQSSFALWDTPFSRGEIGIPINGLIWMNDIRTMSEQVENKISQGFRCIKLKIGALEFEKETELIRSIRKRYSNEKLTLRVDANGAFSPKDAAEKLNILFELGIHSIEQPIIAGKWKEMQELIANSPLPVALDEELIGHNNYSEKSELLKTIKPNYIVLKPSLHGGIKGCSEWIEIAKKMDIGWWLTSALESNIGLNAIAQWCATLNNPLHQGLGTGLLYTNNIDLPLKIIGEELWYKV